MVELLVVRNDGLSSRGDLLLDGRLAGLVLVVLSEDDREDELGGEVDDCADWIEGNGEVWEVKREGSVSDNDEATSQESRRELETNWES
jgi:hypothetical protein